MNATRSFRNPSFWLVNGDNIKLIAPTGLMFLWALAQCSAVQFTFEGPPYPGASYPQAPGTSVAISHYSESGMAFWNPYGVEGFAVTGSGASSDPDNGTAYFRITANAKLGFVLTSGMHFNLVSFDAAEYVTNLGPVTLQVVGYKGMGQTVTNSFSLDGINDGTGPLQDFQTFYFDSSFVDLGRVDILTDRWSLDNLVISGVPEPSSGALVLLGSLCGLGWSRVKRRGKRVDGG